MQCMMNLGKLFTKREKLGVTCLDTGVALPHADPQTIKKSRIILLTLKTSR